MTEPEPRGSAGQQARYFALFLLKIFAMIAGLTAFGFVIFLLSRSLH